MKTQIYILAVASMLFVGCNDIPSIPQPYVPQNRNNFISPTDNNLTQPIGDINQSIPKLPKKHIKLKEVHDNDFTPEYMYPVDKKDKEPLESEISNNINNKYTNMSETECITLIGQERFDRYVKMLGSKQDAIKRCQIIKLSQS